jgi:5-methyltetrahydropteroyltriglutamate--homocysteine methyltransferase
MPFTNEGVLQSGDSNSLFPIPHSRLTLEADVSHSILTTVVGSYPVPDWLAALPSDQALRDAMAVVIKTQEAAGIDVVTDGELSRFDINHPETNGMVEYFVSKLANVRTAVGRRDEERFRGLTHMEFRAKPAGVVEGQLGDGILNLPHDYQRARAIAGGKLKFTVTSPYMLARTLLDTHYKGLRDLTYAIADVLAGQIAEIDADVVQIDEANLPGNPDDGPWVAETLNRIFDAVQKKAALHMCFGNYGGQPIQKGNWGKLIGFLNACKIDHVVTEMAFRGGGEIEFFKELRPEIGVGLGVIDVKKTVVESPEEIARAIEKAEKILGAGRVTYVHPDCGFWMLKRTIADAKMGALVKGRDLYLGVGR